jgi:hypothetical protein
MADVLHRASNVPHPPKNARDLYVLESRLRYALARRRQQAASPPAA